MLYEIWGGNMPAVTIALEKNESIYTQSGGMSWMTPNIEMTTNTKGGIMKGFGRMFSGESFFMATYTAKTEGQQITLASTMPGEIKVFNITPSYEIIAQKGAFLCAEQSVEIKAEFTKDFKSGLFGGEGFILQRYTGSGNVFLELDGTVKEINLGPGQVVKVDTGNIAAFESSITYSAEMVKGFKNVLFGGEGLFLSTLKGPGRVWLQTMTSSELAKRILPYIPTSN